MPFRSVKPSRAVLACVVCCICLVLASMVLYVHDDLGWGSQSGLDLLSRGFDGENGRYLGNLLVLGLTRSQLFKTLFMGICLTLMTLLPAMNAPRERRTGAMLLMCCLMGALPTNIARQTLGWVSGFANYGTSATLIAVFLLPALALAADFDPARAPRPVWWPAMFVLGLAGALLMENVTIFFCVVPLGLYLYGLRRGVRAHGMLLCSLGAVCGAALMFSNSVYGVIFSGGDSYGRTISLLNAPLQALAACWNTFATDMVYPFLLDCIPMLLAFSVALLAQAVRERGANRSRLLAAARYYCICMPLWPIVQKLHPLYAPLRAYTPHLTAALCLLYAVSLGVVLLLSFPQGATRRRCLLLYLSVFVLVAPLSAVTPVGGRCFLPSYVIMALLCTLLLQEAFAGVRLPHAHTALALVACFYAALWLHVYYFNARTQDERLAYLYEQVEQGAQSAVIAELPYPGYVWIASPYDPSEAMTFKRFYGLPEDLELTVISYPEWYTLRESK